MALFRLFSKSKVLRHYKFGAPFSPNNGILPLLLQTVGSQLPPLKRGKIMKCYLTAETQRSQRNDFFLLFAETPKSKINSSAMGGFPQSDAFYNCLVLRFANTVTYFWEHINLFAHLALSTEWIGSSSNLWIEGLNKGFCSRSFSCRVVFHRRPSCPVKCAAYLTGVSGDEKRCPPLRSPSLERSPPEADKRAVMSYSRTYPNSKAGTILLQREGLRGQISS